jgi:hypothetical protein
MVIVLGIVCVCMSRVEIVEQRVTWTFHYHSIDAIQVPSTTTTTTTTTQLLLPQGVAARHELPIDSQPDWQSRALPRSTSTAALANRMQPPCAPISARSRRRVPSGSTTIRCSSSRCPTRPCLELQSLWLLVQRALGCAGRTATVVAVVGQPVAATQSRSLHGLHRRNRYRAPMPCRSAQ